MKGWQRFAALVFGFALTIYLTYYISKLPGSNCTTSPTVNLWSADHAYKATLLKKDCNLSETIFYSVRVDKPGAWFLRMEIEQDPYPAQAIEPVMRWDSHKLEIEVSVEKIRGSIERREGDLTIVRSYIVPKP